MSSKQVRDRSKSADRVVASGEAHAVAIRAELEEVLRPFLAAGEPMPNLEVLVRLLDRWLAAAATSMVERDHEHQGELDDDPPARDQRDALVRSTADLVIDLRERLTFAYGAEAIRRWGLDGPTPDEPRALVAFVEELARRLRTQPLPAAKRPSAAVEPEAEARALEAAAADLKGSLATVDREAREAETTLVARDRATDEHDRVFAAVANLQVALLEAAGMPELADRVRPSSRRAGTLELEEAESTTPV